MLRAGKKLVSIEVKSGGRRGSASGMEAFARTFRPTRQLLVGGGGIPLEEFLRAPGDEWLG